jgi:rRNA maturation endonuclease Nob1
MKIKGYSFKCESPFFVYFKKHYCPYCGNKLARKKASEIIHSNSDAAKNYDFEVADITVQGNMKFTHIVFSCDACQKIFTVKELERKL